MGEMVQRLKQLWPIQLVRRARYRRYFDSPRGYSMHDGVYRTFEEASAAVPKSGGFDQVSLASEYDDRTDRVFPYDYPILFWLQGIFGSVTSLSLVDVGGHIGVHYYAYKRFLRFPPELKWLVIEVDKIAQAGRERAERLGAVELDFGTSLEALASNPVDLVLSAGALHYVEQPFLWDVIARAQSKPCHILLNKIPLYDGEDFVSLQNIGRGFAALYVWNRRQFIGRFEKLGYELVDDWSVLERNFSIFDDPNRSFGPFSGLYLRRPPCIG